MGGPAKFLSFRAGIERRSVLNRKKRPRRSLSRRLELKRRLQWVNGTGMHTRRNLFPTPLVIDELEGFEEFNSELERLIYEKMEADAGIKRSNVGGGWHSKTDLLKWGGPAAQRVAEMALALADANTSTTRGAELAWKIVGWANVNGPGAGNAPHIHGGNYWSAVYYVKVPEGEGGRLTLHDPRLPALRMHSPVLRFKNGGPEVLHRLQPSPGQILLFPAWLSHSVEPWNGEGHRISIAMNIRRANTAAKTHPS